MSHIAINGFGRIGRLVFKIGLEKKLDIVAINDLTEPRVLAYLLKYDTIYGRYHEEVSYGDDFIKVGNKKIKVIHESEPEKLPWKAMKIDAVIECTGRFTKREDAEKHLAAGAKRVFISAPAKNHDVTLVPGVNMEMFKPEHKIISVASCTTNCMAPVAKVLDDTFGIEQAFMTTVHAYTNNQKILDIEDKKLRRGRAAALNIIPTTTGAAQAIAEVLPHLKGKFDGIALRVPVGCGSIIDLTANVKKKATAEEVNKAFRKAAEGTMKGILEYSDEELVSSDIIGNPHSAIVDGLSTAVVDGSMVRVLAWYDNEYGYSNRLVDVIKKYA